MMCRLFVFLGLLIVASGGEGVLAILDCDNRAGDVPGEGAEVVVDDVGRKDVGVVVLWMLF